MLSNNRFNKKEIFQCTDYERTLSKRLQTFYKNQEFFDVMLITQIDNCKVPAHRVVLSAMSKFFYDQFRGGDYKTITLQEINGDTLKSIIGFMYTGSIEIRMETVQSLLRAASIFQLNSLVAAFWAFLLRYINVSNCLFITFLAEEYKYIDLYAKAFIFVCEHFEMVCEEIQFLNLTESQLTRLISNDDINVCSERTVFLSVLAWVKYDKANRDNRMVHLLSYVRYEWLTAKFIIRNMPFLCEGECCDLVSDWLRWHMTPENRPQLCLRHNIARKSYEKLALGTWSSTSGYRIQTFDQNSNSWSFEEYEIWPPSRPREEYTCEVILGKLFICGGTIDGSITNSIEYLDIQTKKFKNLLPMNTARRLPGLMACNGDLYAVGGYDSDTQVLDSVEKYDSKKCIWKYVAPLPRRFECRRLASSNRLLYVLGKDDTMLCYNPTIDKWAEKSYPERKSRCIDVRGCLYAYGGSDNDIQAYNPSEDIWTVTGASYLPENLSTCTSFRNRLVFYGSASEGDVALYKYNIETMETIKLIQPNISDEIHWCELFTL